MIYINIQRQNLFVMKKLLLILSLISISFSCFSQDKIIRKNGNIIECKVLSVDSIYVNFNLQHGNSEVKTVGKTLPTVRKGIMIQPKATTSTATPAAITRQIAKACPRT